MDVDASDLSFEGKTVQKTNQIRRIRVRIEILKRWRHARTISAPFVDHVKRAPVLGIPMGWSKEETIWENR